MYKKLQKFFLAVDNFLRVIKHGFIHVCAHTHTGTHIYFISLNVVKKLSLLRYVCSDVVSALRSRAWV